ncbi:MAG: PepSY domain-containing protein [Burkholderiales bacterium]|nr:PepSY domain-containing protein [Burkholderiales bacterium]
MTAATPETPPRSARRIRSDRIARVYRSVWRWHFWSGLLITPVLIIASITGALYVFKPEIERWAHPDMLRVEPGTTTVGLDRMRSVLAEALPEHELKYINVSTDPAAPWEAIVQKPLGERRVQTAYAYFDPYRGRYLGMTIRSEGFFGIVLQLHRNLMAGLPGRILVEAATCWGIISVIAGMYLWWPRKKEKVWGVWIPRVRGGVYRLLRDWHTVIGMYLSVFIVLILLSGLLFSQIWGSLYYSSNFFTGGFPAFLVSPPQSVVAKEGEAPPSIGIDAAFDVATRHFDFTKIAHSIEVPKPGSTGAYQVISETQTPLIERSVVFIDQYSGQTLLFAGGDQIPWRTHLTLLFYPVHVGSIFGLPTKILAVLSCLVLVAMSITGVWMWWHRVHPGHWALPVKPPKGTAPRWLVWLTVALAVLLPTVGITLLLSYLVDPLARAGRRLRAKPEA